MGQELRTELSHVLCEVADIYGKQLGYIYNGEYHVYEDRRNPFWGSMLYEKSGYCITHEWSKPVFEEDKKDEQRSMYIGVYNRFGNPRLTIYFPKVDGRTQMICAEINSDMQISDMQVFGEESVLDLANVVSLIKQKLVEHGLRKE